MKPLRRLFGMIMMLLVLATYGAYIFLFLVFFIGLDKANEKIEKAILPFAEYME